MPLLSICIPTYNRCQYLKKNLDYFVAHNSGDIEIIICDNASSDETAHVVTDVIESNCLDNFTYIRNEFNIGPDANFKKALSMSKGIYTLLLGDDDFLNDNFLDEFLDALKTKKEQLSFITLMPTKDKTEPNRFIQYSIDGFDKYLIKTGPQITFMSSMVFNTNLMQKVLNLGIEYEINLFQSFLQVEVIRRNPKYRFGIFYSDIFSYNGEPTATNYNFYDVFVSKIIRLYCVALPTLSKSEVANIYKQAFMGYLIKFTIILKVLDQRPKMNKEAFDILKHFIVTWLILMPVYCVPGFIYKMMYAAYKNKRSES